MKKIVKLLLPLVLVLLMTTQAFASTADYTGEDGWHVVFTKENKMESTFGSKDFDDDIYGMQPGDNVLFTLTLENQNEATTDWYMQNAVISSLEDSRDISSGGAYTYRLAYINSAGEETVLFDSETVGGDTIGNAGEGLNEATDALDEYFYLDTLTTNQDGRITLEVALDGETQGNDYQDTLANLQMEFAVELTQIDREDDTPRPSSTPTPNRTTVVKTGDETNLVPYIIAALVSGVLLLFFAVFSLRRRKNEQRKGQ